MDDGAILLSAPTERKVDIEVGYGLEPTLTDALTSRIIHERITRYSIKEWMTGEKKPGSILFITSTYTDLELNRALLTLWSNLAIHSLMTMSRTRDLRTWFMFDELGALHRLPAIENGLQTARNFGGAMVLGLHSFDKLIQVYGEENARNLSSLARTKLILAAANHDTAEVCSQFIGNREIRQMDDGHQVVLGTMMMLVGANSRDVAEKVSAALPRIRRALPPGMRLRTAYSRATLVDATVGTVRDNLSIGALLVCVVLLVVLGSWRAALLVAIVIPTAFAVAVCGMHIAGVSGNLMSLGALDFGMIVDGAIVIVENSLRLMTQRRANKGDDLDPEERRVAVVDAAKQVVGPMVFGVAIITLVYVPVLSLTGVEGKTFHRWRSQSCWHWSGRC